MSDEKDRLREPDHGSTVHVARHIDQFGHYFYSIKVFTKGLLGDWIPQAGQPTPTFYDLENALRVARCLSAGNYGEETIVACYREGQPL